MPKTHLCLGADLHTSRLLLPQVLSSTSSAQTVPPHQGHRLPPSSSHLRSPQGGFVPLVPCQCFPAPCWVTVPAHLSRDLLLGSWMTPLSHGAPQILFPPCPWLSALVRLGDQQLAFTSRCSTPAFHQLPGPAGVTSANPTASAPRLLCGTGCSPRAGSPHALSLTQPASLPRPPASPAGCR